MSKHTPEPWAIHEDASGDIFISGSYHTYIAEIGNPDEDGAAADARRIVACVNACAGLPTEQLESGPLGGILNGAAGLVSQCDDLLKVKEDHDRLVRELDVLLNGVDGAANQASLCDLVAQLKAKGV